MYEAGPFGQGSGAPVPVAVETFHALQQRQMGETAGAGGPAGRRGRGGGGRSRINLLNWDGSGVPAGLFPESNNEDSV
jgi:nitrate reductase beta subunit